jgi:hypothetical protein
MSVLTTFWRVLLLFMICTSLWHAAVLCLSLAANQGVYVPILETLDEWILYCVQNQPKHYKIERSIQDTLVGTLLTLASVALTTTKTIVLVVTGGTPNVGKITLENYDAATESWNKLVLDGLYYTMHGFIQAPVRLFHTAVVSVSRLFPEWSITIVASSYLVFTFLLLLLGRCSLNSCKLRQTRRHSIHPQETDEDSAEADDSNAESLSEGRQVRHRHHRRQRRHREKETETSK